MADFDTLFTEKECNSLLSKCMLRYDPGHFSFKPRLFFVKNLENLQPYRMNFNTEHNLLGTIDDHFKIGILSNVNYKGLHNSIELVTSNKITTSENWNCMLIHRNNYYVNLKKLAEIFKYDLHGMVKLKSSRLYEAITTFMLAASHYNSLIPHLKWLCSSYVDHDFYSTIELHTLENDLENQRDLEGDNIMLEHTVASCTEMFRDIKNAPCTPEHIDDTYFKQVWHEFLVFGVEIIGRIESITDYSLKEIIYELFKPKPPAHNDIVNLLYAEDGAGDIRPTKEVLDIANIKDMEQRYYAIRDFVKAHDKDIEEACKKSPIINPIFAEFVKYCQNESVMNIRIKTIFVLYNYVKKMGWKVEKDTDCKGGIPLPGMLGGVADDSYEEMPESYSMMDENYADYGDAEKTPREESTSKPKKESATIYEELDKLSSTFKSGGYDFNVKDVKSIEDVDRTKYLKLSENMSLLNSNLIRSIKEIKVYNVGGKNPGKRTGKIDRKNLYKYKTSKDIFFDNTYKIKESDLAFGILLDVSGSMDGDGIRNGKATMIVLHETLKALNINHCIATHTSRRRHHCVIDRYQAFKEDRTFQCDKNYAIVNIEADWGNCDSGALYYMEQEILRTKNKDKICLIFSDGEPTECSDAELKDQIRHMERNGITVIGIGIDYPKIKEYYSNNANGKNLKEMFDIVSNILKQYVLEKVDKE